MKKESSSFFNSKQIDEFIARNILVEEEKSLWEECKKNVSLPQLAEFGQKSCWLNGRATEYFPRFFRFPAPRVAFAAKKLG